MISKMPIKPPTEAEIIAAVAAVTADGPSATTTAELGLAVHNIPLLKACVARIGKFTVKSIDATRSQSPLIESAISGALMLGLNYGIRIGEARGSTGSTQPTGPKPN